MAQTDEARPSRQETIDRIAGLIRSSRANHWIYHFWRRTGNVRILRTMLEFEVLERPELRKLLERVIEYEGHLVTASRIVTTE